MAHFAELDENNIVLRVLVTDNNETDEGLSWLSTNLGGRWIQTSYTGRIRKNYAGVGYSYDETLDAFIPAQCHTEATLNVDTALWDCINDAHLETYGTTN